MDALNGLVTRAQAGDLNAYNSIVRRFQDMAVGYAYSLVGDFHLAEDAAQEAFLGAYLDLPKLRNPEAFPCWFRRIVFMRCTRFTRGRGVETVPMDAVGEVAVEAQDPIEAMEDREVKDRVLRALDALPGEERVVTTLFYIGGYSHKEIAAFLNLPTTTVNNRLRAARKRLKIRMLDMAKKRLHDAAPSRVNGFVTAVGMCNAAQAGDLGRVVQILELEPELASAAHPDHKRKPIHYAAREGHAEVVRILLEAGANPLQGVYPNREATSPLTLARDREHSRVVEAIEEWLSKNRGTTSRGEELCGAANRGDTDRVREILEDDPSTIHETDEQGNTALHHAVIGRRLQMANLLLENGAEVDRRNVDGERPIHLALFKGMGGAPPFLKESDHAMAGLLLGMGADYDIWVASALGDEDGVREMLEGDAGLANFHNGVKSVNPGGKVFPLSLAAHQGHLEVVRLLLDYGADPDAENMTGDKPDGYREAGVPLLFAIHKRHFDIAHLLLDRGARADTPPVYACPAVADAAYECGDEALANRIFINGGRPLIFTYVKHRNYLVIGELLDHQAAAPSPAEKLKEGHGDILKQVLRWGMYFGDTSLVQMCLEKKPEMEDREWFEVMWEALRFGDENREGKLQILQMVLDHGVNPNLRDKENETLLHRTQGCGWRNGRWNNSEEAMIALTSVLLNNGADINARDDEMKATPLGLHARYGHGKVVAFLLERGAATSLPDDKPWATPLAWAEKMGHAEVAELLQAQDATG